mgnify:CR=1 FL=1
MSTYVAVRVIWSLPFLPSQTPPMSASVRMPFLRYDSSPSGIGPQAPCRFATAFRQVKVSSICLSELRLLVARGNPSTLERPEAGCWGHGAPPRGSGGAPGQCIIALAILCGIPGAGTLWGICVSEQHVHVVDNFRQSVLLLELCNLGVSW